MMRGLGQGVQSFKRGMRDPIEEDVEPNSENSIKTNSEEGSSEAEESKM